MYSTFLELLSRKDTQWSYYVHSNALLMNQTEYFSNIYILTSINYTTKLNIITAYLYNPL